MATGTTTADPKGKVHEAEVQGAFGNITKEEVFRVCRETMGDFAPAAPDKPTPVHELRQRLGDRGSNATIQKYRDLWLRMNQRGGFQPPGAPASDPPLEGGEAESAAQPERSEAEAERGAETGKREESSDSELSKNIILFRQEIKKEADAQVERFREFVSQLADDKAAKAAAEARLAEKEAADVRLEAVRVANEAQLAKSHREGRRSLVVAVAIALTIGLYVGWSIVRVAPPAAPTPTLTPSSVPAPAAAQTSAPLQPEISSQVVTPPAPTPAVETKAAIETKTDTKVEPKPEALPTPTAK